MRPIKFRAWDSKYNDMVGMGVLQCSVFSDYFQSTRFNIMQFTGLTDKNGVEIYEGDILRYRFRSHEGNDPSSGQVLMDDFMWCVTSDRGEYGMYSLNRINDVEVIGNIYENPELLGDTDVS